MKKTNDKWDKVFIKQINKSKQHIKFYNTFNLDAVKRNSRIIDIGCGRGDMVKYLNLCGFYNVIGIDISDSLYDIELKEKLFVGDARHLSFKDNSFDLVLMNGVLHHLNSIPEIEECLKEIKRVLKPNKRFYLREPMNTLFRRFGNFMIFTPLSNLFEYSRNMRVLHEEEWTEYTYWLRNQKEIIKLINEEFEVVNFKKDLLSMYYELK